MKTLFQTALIMLSLLLNQAQAARLKDLVSIEGVRENQLIGYGLVVGLAGTGDRRHHGHPAARAVVCPRPRE